MDVLVIGYGKIGQIKAAIWRTLGRRVYVYDTDANKVKHAKTDGYSIHADNRQYSNDLLADVSTPAHYHLHSLRWLLDHVTSMPNRVLIEKPLASTGEEISAWLELLGTEQGKDLDRRIIVNESYYLSTALEYVANDIARHGHRLQSISTELSKNRLPDVSRGRFVDETLGSLGIELPHMIAMMQRLGVQLHDLAVDGVHIYRGDKPHNEGFQLDLSSNNMSVTISSYLGDFRIAQAGAVLPNTTITRSLEVVTDGRHYTVDFDPVKGLDRYKARVRVKTDKFSATKTIILDDDHLANHLRKIHEAISDDQLDPLFGARNALAISKFILELKGTARYFSVDPVPARTYTTQRVSTALGEYL